MKVQGIFVVMFLVCAPALQVTADLAAPVHSCQRPNKPVRFDLQAQLDAFNQEVEQYQYCINDFVETQNRAIEYHQAASVAAITEWNLFVESELQ